MRRPRALASAADMDVSHLNTVYHTNKYHAVFLLLSSLSISYRPKLPAPPKARMPRDNKKKDSVCGDMYGTSLILYNFLIRQYISLK